MGHVRTNRPAPKLSQREERILIALIFGFALFSRIALAWPALVGGYTFKIGDDDDYYRIAVSLLTTGQFADNGVLTAYRMPMFPFLLASQYALFGTAPETALPIQLILSALTGVGTYILGCRIGGSKVGLLAVALFICDLNLNYYASLLMTETLVTFLITASLLALDTLRERRSKLWAALTGLLFGMTILTRVNMLVFLPVAIGWFIWVQRSDRRTAIQHSVVIAAIALTCWGGWVARNALAFGAFIPLTTQSGNGYIGVYNDVTAAAPRFGDFGLWTWIEYPTPQGIAPTDQVALDRVQRRVAMEWITEHPWTALQLALAQPNLFWRSEIIDLGAYLYPTFGFAGLILMARRRQPVALLWVLLVVTLTAFTIVSLGVPRFHQPLNPPMAVFTAVALLSLFGWMQQRWLNRKRAYAPPDPQQ